MDSLDHYDTINNESVGLYKEKGSKFHSYAYPIIKLEDVRERLISLKEIHPKSRHICYAYRMDIEGTVFRYNDDGEPSGTAGRPIFNSILSHELSDILVCVVRYFGGTKLGATGLIRAYRTAADDCIDNNGRRTIYLTKKVELVYPIEIMGKIFKILKGLSIDDIECTYDPTPKMLFNCRLSLIDQTLKNITGAVHGYAPSELSDDFESDIIKLNVIE